MGKLLWDIVSDSNKPWVQVVKAKYLCSASIWQAKCNAGSSHIWRGIIKSRDALKDGFCFSLGAGDTSVWFSDWNGHGFLSDVVPFVHVTDTNVLLRDLVDDDRWRLERLYTWLTPEIVDVFNQLVPHLTPLRPDRWVWEAAGTGVYTVASGYSWLRYRAMEPINCNSSFRWIWTMHCPEKIRLLVWFVGQQGIPTNEKRFLCHLIDSPACSRCFAPAENLLHCLRDCPHALEVWSRLGVGDQTFFTNTDATDWIHLNGRTGSDSFRCPVWKSPPIGVTKINVDGSCLLHNSRLGVGGVFRDFNGKWISGFSGFVGLGESIVAEFQAVYWGLHLALELGFRKISLESDALEVVQSLNMGDPPYLDVHADLLGSIKELMRSSMDVSITFSPRESNKAADWLAKHGAWSSHPPALLESPPPEVETFLLSDVLVS
ncbi:Ribonuclease H domain [Sesbania bispinosa]|nr:Ribonuclease H domain [Sesbania bispinosa]